MDCWIDVILLLQIEEKKFVWNIEFLEMFGSGLKGKRKSKTKRERERQRERYDT